MYNRVGVSLLDYKNSNKETEHGFFIAGDIIIVFHIFFFRLVRRGGICGNNTGKGIKQRLFKRTGLPHLRLWYVVSVNCTAPSKTEYFSFVFGRYAYMFYCGIIGRLDIGQNISHEMVGLFGQTF